MNWSACRLLPTIDEIEALPDDNGIIDPMETPCRVFLFPTPEQEADNERVLAGFRKDARLLRAAHERVLALELREDARLAREREGRRKTELKRAREDARLAREREATQRLSTEAVATYAKEHNAMYEAPSFEQLRLLIRAQGLGIYWTADGEWIRPPPTEGPPQ